MATTRQDRFRTLVGNFFFFEELASRAEKGIYGKIDVTLDSWMTTADVRSTIEKAHNIGRVVSGNNLATKEQRAAIRERLRELDALCSVWALRTAAEGT